MTCYEIWSDCALLYVSPIRHWGKYKRYNIIAVRVGVTIIKLLWYYIILWWNLLKTITLLYIYICIILRKLRNNNISSRWLWKFHLCSGSISRTSHLFFFFIIIIYTICHQCNQPIHSVILLSSVIFFFFNAARFLYNSYLAINVLYLFNYLDEI